MAKEHLPLPDKQVLSPHFFRTHFCTSQLHIKVRMIMMIASCIATVFHKDFIIGPFLSFASGHITFTLLSNNIGNPGFLVLKL